MGSDNGAAGLALIFLLVLTHTDGTALNLLADAGRFRTMIDAAGLREAEAHCGFGGLFGRL